MYHISCDVQHFGIRSWRGRFLTVFALLFTICCTTISYPPDYLFQLHSSRISCIESYRNPIMHHDVSLFHHVSSVQNFLGFPLPPGILYVLSFPNHVIPQDALPHSDTRSCLFLYTFNNILDPSVYSTVTKAGSEELA